VDIVRHRRRDRAVISCVWQSAEQTCKARRAAASCGGTEGPSGEYCSIQVSDTGLLDSERSIQKAHDDAQQKQHAPSAPQL